MKRETETETENENETIDSNDLASEKSSDSKSENVVTIGALADTLVDEMPEVQHHAIDAHEEKELESAAQWADLRDVDGNPFDPTIHKVNKEGEPTVTKKGNLIKKPGRKKATKSVIGVKAGPSTEESEAQQVKAQSRATGRAAANMIIMFGTIIGGDEWQAMKNDEIGLDEKSMLENAFADYFESTGKTDLPPGMILAVSLTAYAAPRFTMPKTKARAGGIKKWFKKKLADRKLKKHGLKAVEKESKADDN